MPILHALYTHSSVFCAIHENACLKFPAIQTIIDQQPQLLCAIIDHCIIAKAVLLMDYS